MSDDITVTLHFKDLEPHPKQRLFVESVAKRKIVRAGRRGGKTTAAAQLAATHFLNGERVIYTTPTADQLEAFWREVCGIFAESFPVGVLKKNESEHFIERPGTATRIRARTAWNADMLRGQFADLLIIDEFQLCDETLYSEVGLPMTLDRGGSVVLIYTPASLRSRSVSKARDKLHAARLFEKVKDDPRWLAIHWTSKDNPFLNQQALEEISFDMTSLTYRQEIEAEDIQEVPGALWNRERIENTRVAEIPTVIRRIVIGVDPSGGNVTEAGVVAAGIGEDDHIYVMADSSRRAASPLVWASAAVSLYHNMQADRITCENNFGGAMVRSTIQGVDENVPITETTSRQSKLVRAEPIAALFEQKRAHIVGQLPELEDEMCGFDGTGKSPNRLDAMVFAVAELVNNKMGLTAFYRREAAKLGPANGGAPPAMISGVLR